jgi:hypothetical protein
VKTRGWFRRNVWGLILVPPLVAGLFAFNAGGLYKANYTLRPKQPVPVDGTGLATLDGYEVRLAELAPVENEVDVKQLLGFNGQPLPATVKIWRLILTVRVPEGSRQDSGIGTCRVSLEDDAGNRYGAGPSELRGGPVSVAGSCYADDDDQPMPYTATSVFLLPAQRRPTSVVITWIDRLPRYVRFPVLP